MRNKDEAILSMIDISKKFPGVQALDHANFTLMPNEIHALLGENGAGKSVLLKTLLGVHQKDSGKIILEGEEIVENSPSIARKAGLSAVYQELRLARPLTVAENILLGQQPNRHGLLDEKARNRKVQEILDKYNIQLDLNAKVRDLIVAQQQMVAIAKALATDCKVLILDEPTAMLTDAETQTLFEAMRRLKAANVSIIYVSHRLEEIFEVCDHVTIMRDGQTLGSDAVQNLTKDKMIQMMAGREIKDLYGNEKTEREKRVKAQAILKVEHLTKGKKFQDISFSVNKGEILGFFGLIGSGRTDVMRAVFGADKYDSGTIQLNGEAVKFRTIKEGIRQGLALVPEERATQGVATNLSVKANINVTNYDRVSNRWGLVSARKENDVAQEYIRKLSIKTPTAQQTVGNLSGGNQQKVSIAKWFNTEPKVLIFDEPTTGVDVEARVEIYNLIRNVAEDGGAVIVVSSYLQEILGICDRVIVMSNGRITGELDPKATSDKDVLTYAFQETAN